ncbi:MAG: yocK [Phycisphaerales bacterium]|nr:yocK [Phycisphaerales bacterium]
MGQSASSIKKVAVKGGSQPASGKSAAGKAVVGKGGKPVAAAAPRGATVKVAAPAKAAAAVKGAALVTNGRTVAAVKPSGAAAKPSSVSVAKPQAAAKAVPVAKGAVAVKPSATIKASPSAAVAKPSVKPASSAAATVAKQVAHSAKPAAPSTAKPVVPPNPGSSVKPGVAAAVNGDARKVVTDPKPARPFRPEPPKPELSRPIQTIEQANSSGDSKPKKNQAGLTVKELEVFRDLLLAKRRELVGDMSSMERDALQSGDAGLSSLPVHMADMGTDNYEQEFTLGLVEKDRNLLREINLSLAKIQNGSYGICEGNGKPISKVRLEAQPWAKFSIEYARLQERGPIRR